MTAYLDYNATTPVDPKVFEAMRPYLETEYGNASSFHKVGQAARHAIELARENIADYLGVEPGDIVFTSGGTESDNLAVRGVMDFFENTRRHLVISSIEHQAVLGPAQYLKRKGFEVDIAPVNRAGRVDLNFLKDKVTQKTALVSLMHVNNETGVIQPVEEAAKIAHDANAYFHMDAVQSFGKIKIDLEKINPELITMSSHKICGPKGVGALFIKKGTKLKPVIYGGHQEKNIRPGTENVAAIVGFGEAVRLLRIDRDNEVKRVSKLTTSLFEGLKKAIPDILLNGNPENKIYNTLNLSFPGLDGETLLMNFDLKNICVSTGSACTAGSVEPSHVLIAMGLEEKLARQAVRFSLGRFTTQKEIDYAIKEIPPIVDRLKKAAT